MQSLERQIGSKVIELQQHYETIERQHHNYSSLLKQTDYDIKRKDETIKRLEARVEWLEKSKQEMPTSTQRQEPYQEAQKPHHKRTESSIQKIAPPSQSVEAYFEPPAQRREIWVAPNQFNSTAKLNSTGRAENFETQQELQTPSREPTRAQLEHQTPHREPGRVQQELQTPYREPARVLQHSSPERSKSQKRSPAPMPEKHRESIQPFERSEEMTLQSSEYSKPAPVQITSINKIGCTDNSELESSIENNMSRQPHVQSMVSFGGTRSNAG